MTIYGTPAPRVGFRATIGEDGGFEEFEHIIQHEDGTTETIDP